MKFNAKKFIVNFVRAFPDRQGRGETEAGDFLLSFLHEFNIGPMVVQKFGTYIPRYLKSELLVDGKPLAHLPVGLVGGKLSDKHALVSSLISSQPLIAHANINFNPECATVSRSNHYFAPAWAVRASDVVKILQAKKISANLQVRKTAHQSRNFLAGNVRAPKNILFCHYDSLGPGAMDNASGVAVMLQMIIKKPQLLKNNLFVFAGNEELSYDFPVYWGHGYREFEKKYARILRRANKVIVVDCVGNSKTVARRDPAIVKLGFPIKFVNQLSGRVVMLSGSMDKLYPVYHSAFDTADKINTKYLDDAIRVVSRLIAVG